MSFYEDKKKTKILRVTFLNSSGADRQEVKAPEIYLKFTECLHLTVK